MNLLVRYYIGFTVKYRVRPGRNGTQGFGGNGLQPFLRRWAETFLWRWRAGRCHSRWLIRGRTDFHGWGLQGWSLWAYHNRGANSARHGVVGGRSTPRGPKRLYLDEGVGFGICLNHYCYDKLTQEGAINLCFEHAIFKFTFGFWVAFFYVPCVRWCRLKYSSQYGHQVRFA